MSRPDQRQHKKQDCGEQSGHERQSDCLSNSVSPSILKQARKSGVLNLSQRGLCIIPDCVWTVQDVPEEAKCVSMDSTDDKWWEMVDLTKLLLASNQLTAIGEGLGNLTALIVLDIHDNELTTLPNSIGSLENLKKLDVRHNQLSEIPASIGLLSNLHTLSADYNQLTSINEEFCNLKMLEVLSLSNNLIQSLHRNIGKLSQLKNLNVSNNKLTSLPPELGALSCLHVFDASHNQLVNLPEEFGDLSKLEQLHLRHNQLRCLPVLRTCRNLKEFLVGGNSIKELTVEHLKHLGSLSCLDIRDNKLEKLPDEISLLEKLKRLDLANNSISELPSVLYNMTNLKTVVLDGNPVHSLKKDITVKGTIKLKNHLASCWSDAEAKNSTVSYREPGVTAADETIRDSDLHHMKSLDYSNRKLLSLSNDVVQAALEAGVRVVNLEKNLFSEIPCNLSVLADSLTELHIGCNKLTQISNKISQLNKLQLLDLRANQLFDLPPELSDLSGLRELIISNNRFTEIPPVVYSLANLEILSAHDNHVTEINMQGFFKLTKLATLDLQNNDISQIPPELGNCVWLKSLALIGNPVRNPRPAILARETHAVLEYLRSRIVVQSK